MDALVVVVDGYSEFLLCSFLTDDVLLEELFDLNGCGRRGSLSTVLESIVVRNDLIADFHALIANEHRRPGDELAHVALILVAERTA